MTREEGLHSYTGAAAFGAFEEDKLGQLIPGLNGDFIVLSNNLLSCEDDEIMETKVLETWVGGKRAF
ncbi:MAG: putative amidohydrolase YtcJ [Neolewinella sp.]|jgi:predicted amidohydrolase YtcJ